MVIFTAGIDCKLTFGFLGRVVIRWCMPMSCQSRGSPEERAQAGTYQPSDVLGVLVSGIWGVLTAWPQHLTRDECSMLGTNQITTEIQTELEIY